MNITSLIFALVISSLCGAIFHFMVGGGPGRLILYLVLSWIGFAIGHIVAGLMGWSFADIGPLHIGTATVGSIIFLGVGYWLSYFKPEEEEE